jgi:RecA-family ATPase
MIMAKGLVTPDGKHPMENVDLWNLRGFAQELGIVYNPIKKAVLKGGYKLLILDPIYKTLGDADENSARDINALLNLLDKISLETKTAIAFGTHFPKGKMGGRTAMDRIAGSGVFARNPDAIITMSPATQPKGVTRRTVKKLKCQIISTLSLICATSPKSLLRLLNGSFRE